MSKYIIELDYDLQRVVGIGVKQGTAWIKDYDVDDLEELCADYINEHYGSLQDDAYKRGVIDGSIDMKERVDGAYQKGLEDGKQTAVGAAELREKLEYQKGFEDGKAIHEKGCEGCRHAVMGSDTAICSQCCNAYYNKWTAKDDKIEVGDEVKRKRAPKNDGGGIVTKEWKDIYYIMWPDGSSGKWDKDKVVKTGRHFDIASILEDMRCGQ